MNVVGRKGFSGMLLEASPALGTVVACTYQVDIAAAEESQDCTLAAAAVAWKIVAAAVAGGPH